jgi:DNA-binding NarL/FixJ family response regulator
VPRKILVAEDFEEFRRLVCSLLQPEAEFQVELASNGLEAVHKAEEIQPDLIILDISLPKLNGIEVARRVPKLAPAAKVLFLSVESDADLVNEALSLGAGYIHKSRASRDLLPAVDAVLKGEQFVGRPMPYRFEFDSTNGILQGSFEGFVSKQEVWKFYQTAVKHVAELSPRSYVIDVSAVTSTTVTTGALLELAKLPAVLPSSQSHRFIVASRTASFWLMRMYAVAAMATRPNIHIVRNHAEAWAILGIAEPRFEAI